jgi:hypothetical protein
MGHREVGLLPQDVRHHRRPSRLRVWVRRYAPAEAAAVLAALVSATVADRFGVPAVTAFAGAIGEGVAFYTVIILRELRASRGRPVLGVARDLLLEFGPAELLDALVVRPLAMYLGPVLTGNLAAGILLGKVAADAVFYTLAAVGHEARRSLFG